MLISIVSSIQLEAIQLVYIVIEPEALRTRSLLFGEIRWVNDNAMECVSNRCGNANVGIGFPKPIDMGRAHGQYIKRFIIQSHILIM